MNISTPFIQRPIGTSLLTAAVMLAGAIAYRFLPVAPLPQVEFPTIQVQAALPGASPETMASSVATPLERQFGRIAGVTEMTSSSLLGSTTIALQFDLNSQHRRGGARRAGGHQRFRGPAAGESSQPAHLPKNQSCRLADHDPFREFRYSPHGASFTTSPTRSSRRNCRRLTASARCTSAEARARPCASK